MAPPGLTPAACQNAGEGGAACLKTEGAELPFPKLPSPVKGGGAACPKAREGGAACPKAREGGATCPRAKKGGAASCVPEREELPSRQPDGLEPPSEQAAQRPCTTQQPLHMMLRGVRQKPGMLPPAPLPLCPALLLPALL
ncbi:UNVERIFIED_CONTAM: hypothetical protein FKN15_060874 [Acipenser sinensis]